MTLSSAWVNFAGKLPILHFLTWNITFLILQTTIYIQSIFIFYSKIFLFKLIKPSTSVKRFLLKENMRKNGFFKTITYKLVAVSPISLVWLNQNLLFQILNLEPGWIWNWSSGTNYNFWVIPRAFWPPIWAVVAKILICKV